MKEQDPSFRAKIVKVLAVQDTAARDLLVRILQDAGYRVSQNPNAYTEHDFMVVSLEEIPSDKDNLSFCLLVLSSELPGGVSNAFACCIAEAKWVQKNLSFPARRVITYSVCDQADFTIRDIRRTEHTVSFELDGAGVIGKIRLGAEEQMVPALISAAAAVSCGIPFARAVDSLNQGTKTSAGSYEH